VSQLLSPTPQALACNGQPGVIKPGMDTLTVVGGAALTAAAGAFASPYAAVVIAGILAGTAFDLVKLCTAPDPGDPVLTATDFEHALIISTWEEQQAATARINQWIQHMLWPVYCNCADGTLPPASTSAPLPTTGINTGLPGGTAGATCWDANATINYNGNFQWWFNDYLPPGTDAPGWPAGSGPPPNHLPTPLPTSITFSGTAHSSVTGNQFYNAAIYFRDAAGIIITSGSIIGTQTDCNVPFSLNGAVPTNAAYITPVINSVNNTTPNPTATGRIQLFCGSNTSTTPVVPCCPTDPLLDIRLRRIEQLEEIIIKLLGHGGGGHVDGTRHANLTGSGTVTLVDGIDAIRVEVRSSLAGWPNNPGSPNYYFSLGFVTSIAAGSPLKGWRLVYGSQTFPIVTYADQVGYTLPPGVTIDLVELLPAP
jgi:hypothetical protein